MTIGWFQKSHDVFLSNDTVDDFFFVTNDIVAAYYRHPIDKNQNGLVVNLEVLNASVKNLSY